MTGRNVLGIACLTLLISSPNAWGQVPQAPADAGKKAPAAAEAAAAAAKASPELVGALSKELGATPEQAAGAAGTLFGIAKSRLKAEEFSQVANAVPGMDSLLKAAPAAAGAVGTSGALSQLSGSAAGLATAASAFSKLGLKPEMVAKAIPVLTNFVTKSGGSAVGSLLSGVLK
jgi:Protein of unknown function VcgC/VcgE (DUF2780)